MSCIPGSYCTDDSTLIRLPALIFSAFSIGVSHSLDVPNGFLKTLIVTYCNRLVLGTLISLHTLYPLWTNQPPVVSMSPTGQASSLASSSYFNFQLIVDALVDRDYAKQTGIYLTKNLFARKNELFYFLLFKDNFSTSKCQ